MNIFFNQLKEDENLYIIKLKMKMKENVVISIKSHLDDEYLEVGDKFLEKFKEISI